MYALWAFGSSLSSMHCKCCRMQGLPTEAFFGVPYGPGLGTTLGNTPKDRAFQRAIAKAGREHYEAHHADHPMMKHAPWRR
jgi:hypothetical protein